MLTPRDIEIRPAPVVWHAWQDCEGLMPDYELWTLTADIEGHPAPSSIDRATLERLGYTVPPAPCLSPSAQRARRAAWAGSRRSFETAAPFAHR